jgi:chromosome segregation ATPase
MSSSPIEDSPTKDHIIATLRSKITHLETELTSLRTEFCHRTEIQEIEISHLKSANESLNAELQSQKDRNFQLTTQLTNQQEQLNQKNREISLLQTNCGRLLRRLEHQKQITPNQKQTEENLQESDELRVANERLKEEIEVKTIMLSLKGEVVTALSAEVESYAKENVTLKEILLKLQTQIDRAHQTTSELLRASENEICEDSEWDKAKMILEQIVEGCESA